MASEHTPAAKKPDRFGSEVQNRHPAEKPKEFAVRSKAMSGDLDSFSFVASYLEPPVFISSRKGPSICSEFAWLDDVQIGDKARKR